MDKDHLKVGMIIECHNPDLDREILFIGEETYVYKDKNGECYADLGNLGLQGWEPKKPKPKLIGRLYIDARDGEIMFRSIVERLYNHHRPITINEKGEVFEVEE